jgi:cell division protein ZapA
MSQILQFVLKSSLVRICLFYTNFSERARGESRQDLSLMYFIRQWGRDEPSARPQMNPKDVNFLKTRKFFWHCPDGCVILSTVIIGGLRPPGSKEGFFMANRVVITICEEEYTFIAEESAAYMQKVGSYVSEKMDEVLNSTRVGRADAAVLTAVNIADELFKAQVSAEQLRSQIKGYLDEAGKAQSQVSELKREILRLQQRLDSRKSS